MVTLIVVIFVILFLIFLARAIYENAIGCLDSIPKKILASIIVVCVMVGLCYAIWFI